MSAFNTDEFAWKDIKVGMGGKIITGIRGIKYGVERTMTDIYASGDNPHTRTKGNKKRKGEIKLLQSEAQALLDTAKILFGSGADITDLTVDITVVYAITLSSPIITHQLITVDFPSFELGMEQDDPNMEVTLPCMIGDIKYAA